MLIHFPTDPVPIPAASVTVTLHFNASVAPLDNITALANKLALSSLPTALNEESSVTISPPDSPPVPQLVPEVWYTTLTHCKVGGWFKTPAKRVGEMRKQKCNKATNGCSQSLGQPFLGYYCSRRLLGKFCSSYRKSRAIEQVPDTTLTAFYYPFMQDLVLDVSASTGGGGRSMTSYLWDLYDWSVQQESDVPSAELDLAAAASASGGSSKLTIPGADRASEKEVSWFFNVTAINWLGGIGWKSIEVDACDTVLFLP